MGGVIALPQWYAAFRWPGATPPPPAPSPVTDVLTIGPLSIYRPAAGCQTARFGDPGDPSAVVFDGYLFDRSALRHELALPADANDAAIAAAAYQRWGAGALERLDGSYLLAVWDAREHRLLLGHDCLGHHPVFFAERDDALWFTANVLALPTAGAVPRDPNRVSLALAAARLWPAAGQTFFQHVRRLAPGSMLTASAGRRISTSTYWSPWLDDDDPGLSERETREQFEPTLVGALDRCMALDPDGVMLSGGLDSVTIAALAADYARRHGTPLVRAVSGRRDPLGGEVSTSDEEPMQSAVTAALQMDHLVAYESEWMGSRESIRMSLDAVPELPGPSRIYWVGGYTAFYRFVASHGITAALTGSGGDNWAGVSDAFAAHAIRHLRLRDLYHHFRSWTGTGGLTARQAAQHLLWSGGLRLLLDSWSARLTPGLKASYHRRRALEALPPWLCPDPELREAYVETLLAQRPDPLTPSGAVPRNFYRHAQRTTKNPYYVYEYEVGFHVEGMCGLRLLSPYHDKAVVRFLNSIPPHVLLDGQNYKGMLRPVAQKRLPMLGIEAQRKTYSPETVTSHLDELSHGTDELWREHPLTMLGELGVIDAQVARQQLKPSAQARFDVLLPTYALMSAERWLAHHCTPR